MIGCTTRPVTGASSSATSLVAVPPPQPSRSKTVAVAVELQEYSVASRRAQDCWQTPPEMTTAWTPSRDC